MVDRSLLQSIVQPDENDLTVLQGERCRSLLCKGMFLNNGLGETERVAGDGNFWCGRTQRIYGPDDQLVGDGECRRGERSCYEGR